MLVAALAFLGFAILIAVVVIAASLLSGDIEFALIIAATFMPLGLWSLYGAWQLWSRGRSTAAFSLLGFITTLVVIGALQQGSLTLAEPLHPVMKVLRIFSGAYILVLWVVLLGAVVTRGRQRSKS